MAVFTIVQTSVDLLFLVAAGYFWVRFRSTLQKDEALPNSLAQWEKKRLEAENEIEVLRRQTEEELKRLRRIIEQSHQFLERLKNRAGTFAPTQEERELAEMTSEDAEPPIPTLRDLEKTRHRLKSDICVDLKTLLRDQLS